MMNEVTKTERGFEVIHFDDANGQDCSLQQSSAIGDYADAYDRPGTSFVWLGVGDKRMHMDRGQVVELIAALRKWMDTGSFQ